MPVDIYPAERGFAEALHENGPQMAATIAETIQGYKRQKQKHQLGEQLAEQSGNPLYRQLVALTPDEKLGDLYKAFSSDLADRDFNRMVEERQKGNRPPPKSDNAEFAEELSPSSLQYSTRKAAPLSPEVQGAGGINHSMSDMRSSPVQSPQRASPQGDGASIGSGFTNEEKVRASIKRPKQAALLQEMDKAAATKDYRQNSLSLRKEIAFMKNNEKPLEETLKRLEGIKQNQARYGRLEELFKNEKAFPNGFLASIFSKDGQPDTRALAAMSPEAQEAAKILVDLTSGAKASYGANVTNFDLATEVRKNPSLFNSAAGKMRVLKDLQLMSEINRVHDQAIMDEFEAAGGTGAIPYSEAKRRAIKKTEGITGQLIDAYIYHGAPALYRQHPPQKYKGKKAVDNETGQQFESNGVDWLPVSGEGK